MNELSQGSLRVRNIYQDVSTDITIMGLKPGIAAAYLVFFALGLPAVLILSSGSIMALIGGLFVLLLVYAVLYMDVKEMMRTRKQYWKDKRNASSEYFQTLVEVDVISKDRTGDTYAFTTNTVPPWELAPSEDKEDAATQWAANITELVCHRLSEVSIFAYTHPENAAHLDRKYDEAQKEDDLTKPYTLARVSHHSKLRSISLETTYINRVKKIEGFDKDYTISDLTEFLPGARLGKTSILKYAGHLNPCSRKIRGKEDPRK